MKRYLKAPVSRGNQQLGAGLHFLGLGGPSNDGLTAQATGNVNAASKILD